MITPSIFCERFYMIHFQQNKTLLNHAIHSKNTTEMNAAWQDKITAKDHKTADLGFSQKKPLEMKKINKAVGVYATNAVSRVDAIDFDGEEDAIHFDTNQRSRTYVTYDMAADLNKFVQPPYIDNKNLQKEEMWKMSQEVMEILEQSEASPALKQRAAKLLQEEYHMKTIMSGYENALIFS